MKPPSRRAGQLASRRAGQLASRRAGQLARLGLATFSLAAAALCSVPILAAGLLALLRYGFGSLFVIGESVAAALLHSAGADIAGTMARLQTNLWQGVGTAAVGVVLSAAAAGLTLRHAPAATATVVVACSWVALSGSRLPAALLAAGSLCGLVALAAAGWTRRG